MKKLQRQDIQGKHISHTKCQELQTVDYGVHIAAEMNSTIPRNHAIFHSAESHDSAFKK